MAIVKLQNLTKIYQLGQTQLKALDSIDINIEQGECVAIMGPSGSGKSTLLNMLGCLDTPSSGQYYLADDDVSKLSDDELSRIRGKRIGFIFQSYNLIQQLNVIENIEVPMYYQGIHESVSNQKATKLAEMVGLGDRLKHRPYELSGGQQQRVAIARALANDPVILLADEPTGNLDSKSGQEILDILVMLHENGKTLIIVTHDEKIGAMSQRTIKLLDGRVDNEQYN